MYSPVYYKFKIYNYLYDNIYILNYIIIIYKYNN